MAGNSTLKHLKRLVRSLRLKSAEEEWFEFKHDNADPQRIGRNISALANSALLVGQPHGYVVWGIANSTHELIGTRFNPYEKTRGNTPLQLWLQQKVAPRIGFNFHTLELDGYPIVVLEIEAATSSPVAFDGVEYIRTGSATRELRASPAQLRELWSKLLSNDYEVQVAERGLSDEDVLQLLDSRVYFARRGIPLPQQADLLEQFELEGILVRGNDDTWSITNFGALAMARNLADFPALQRKGVRLAIYAGHSRSASVRSVDGIKGYAVGFSGLMRYIRDNLPHTERTVDGIRGPVVNHDAVREIVANALVHQKFEVKGTSPLIEIFDDRVEVSNPGSPAVDVMRLADAVPRSRNEKLARLLRLMRVCEELGTGIGKVLEIVERETTPAPTLQADNDAMRVVLHAYKSFSEMSKSDVVDAIYWHATNNYKNQKSTNNASVRKRLGLGRDSATATRALKSALDAGRLVVDDAAAGRKERQYLPYWASPN